MIRKRHRLTLWKSDSYEPFRMAGITTSLPAIVDETTHSTYRKLVSSSYTMSALKEYEPYIDEMTKRWLAVFEKFAESGKPMDISLWSHYCWCDTILKSHATDRR